MLGASFLRRARGDLANEACRWEMAETRTLRAELADPDNLVAFDRNRHAMVTIAPSLSWHACGLVCLWQGLRRILRA